MAVKRIAKRGNRAANRNSIDAFVDKKKLEMVEFTEKLIRIPTENPPGNNYFAMVDVLKEFADASGLETRVHGKPGKPNLVARWDLGLHKTLHLNAHYDVVPASGNWARKPFEPVVENGKLYGRGSADPKSDIAAILFSVTVMKELDLRPACNVELSFTCDEETGGADGMGFLVKEKIVKPDLAIVLDGPVVGITNAHKGALALKVTVTGKSCHAAWPHRGKNAFLGACRLALELDALNASLKKKKSKKNTFADIEKYPTLVPGGRAEGGVKFNTVPGEFSFTVDRRILPEENAKDARREIQKKIDEFIANNPGYGVNVETILEVKSDGVSTECPIARALAKSVEAVKGKPAPFYMFPAFHDMRYLINDAKVDCVNYGTTGGNEHGVDEYVNVDSITDLVKILVRTATDPMIG